MKEETDRLTDISNAQPKRLGLETPNLHITLRIRGAQRKDISKRGKF